MDQNKRKSIYKGVQVDSNSIRALINAMDLNFGLDGKAALQFKLKAVMAYLKLAPSDEQAKKVIEAIKQRIKAVESMTPVSKPSSELTPKIETSPSDPARFAKSTGNPVQGGAPGLGRRK
ncbi:MULTISPECIES: hypothetical protein [Pseudomonas]|uniref:hypothetical protein n=1 Tax=Pseudomonas TaxID=286 RepID=UPI00259591A2|nr:MULTISPECIES: hypothetical protein [Pseudomonas]